MSSISNNWLKDNIMLGLKSEDILQESIKNSELASVGLTEISLESFENEKILSNLSSARTNGLYSKGSEELIILRKLKSEIFLIDEEINRLRFNNKLKIIQIENLREIIDRISKEDYFDPVEKKDNIKFKMSSNSKNSKKFAENDIDLTSLDQLKNENFSKSTLDASHESMEDEESGDEGCVIVGRNHKKTDENFINNMEICMSYWIEHLPAQRK